MPTIIKITKGADAPPATSTFQVLDWDAGRPVIALRGVRQSVLADWDWQQVPPTGYEG